MRTHVLLIALVSMVFSSGCAGLSGAAAAAGPALAGQAVPTAPSAGPLAGPVASPLPSAPAGSSDFASVTSWGYLLQNISVPAVSNAPFGLMVMDYSRDGGASGAFTAAEVGQMNGGGRRKLLSYLSIGEAENYRYYWNAAWTSSPPAWLERPNPDWPGNYKVRYWDPAWQQIVFGYVDRIIAAGFDGAYLDIIDAYEYFEEQGDAQARAKMVQFVTSLAQYARAKKPGFGIFPQNGEGLLGDPAYLNVISGIGREETYWLANGSAGTATPAADTARIEGLLDRAVAAGKLVLTIDYTTSADRMRQAHARAKAKRYVEYCGTRELDRLVPQP